jgi:hypothetical protein
MAVEHINRKGQKYYLHQGTTKTGKPKYFFSQKSEGTLVQTTVEKGIQKFSHLHYCKIDVKKDTIYVYTPNQNVNNLSKLYSSFSTANPVDIETTIARSISYSSMLRFILYNEQKRIFTAQRFCFLGSIDDWIGIGYPDTLPTLVEKYMQHLEKDSFYELH